MKLKPFALGAALTFSILSSVAHASTYSFYQLTSNTTDIGNQLDMEVTQSGSNALFKFTNDIGAPSSITAIYFDAPNLFESIGIQGSSSGVSFTSGANPANLPGSSGINFTTNYSFSSTSPHGGNTANGINTNNEWLTLVASLTPNETFNDILAALGSGGLRVGLHVQGINGGTSDSYVNTPSPVPLPAAAWLFGSALLGFTMLSSRKKV
ncbi:MAG TPA: VPLPA-CTERM sorting domain-containing protein [Parasulfuritortus sp.]